MPILPLASGRNFTVADSLLELPVERILHYQCALAPETSVDEAADARFEQQRPQPTDPLSQVARAARLAVFEATPVARGLVVLLTAADGVPVADFSAPALRDRLGWLLTCGLTEEQVQQQQARAEAELRTLIAPYLFAEPATEAQVAEAFAHLKRRTLALCDLMLGAAAVPLASQTAVGQAVLDLLEPATSLNDTSSIHPRIRQHASEALCLLLRHEQLAGRLSCSPTPGQQDFNPCRLPLGVFLEQVQAAACRLPA